MQLQNQIDSDNNPYVGPRPFYRADGDRFFGRVVEARQVVSLVIANPTFLLYAPSGAGKTSLLNASVSPMLEARGLAVLPLARVQGPTADTCRRLSGGLWRGQA